MELSPAVALQLVVILVGMIGLVIGMFVFFARADKIKVASKRVSSFATLLGMLAAFIALFSSNLFEREATFFASLACEADRNFAPARVTCLNLSEDFDSAIWSVNGELVPALSEVMEFDAEEANKYEVTLKLGQRSLFGENTAQSAELVIIRDRSEFERELDVKHRLVFNQTAVRTFDLDAPSGFKIDRDSVIVRLEKHKGAIEILEQRITDTTVSVLVRGISRVRVDFLKVRNESAEGTLTIAFTAVKVDQ